MSRDLVLAVVALSLGGVSLTLGGILPPRPKGLPVGSGLDLERAAWRRLWLPCLPALTMFAILLGWASQEPPETDECLTGAAAVLAVPFAWLALRALIRAARSLGAGGGESPAATSGVLRPRVFVDAAFCAELDQPSLEATYAHERAHARHRDPLRLWLAQLVTDLQWPGRAASLRLQAWRVALELARDEEARLTGVTGEDLAAAIVAALRHHQAQPLGSAVSLVSPEDILRVRIGRLLEPVPPRGRRSFALPVVLTGVVLSCVAWGHWFGDTFLRALPFISSQ